MYRSCLTVGAGLASAPLRARQRLLRGANCRRWLAKQLNLANRRSLLVNLVFDRLPLLVNQESFAIGLLQRALVDWDAFVKEVDRNRVHAVDEHPLAVFDDNLELFAVNLERIAYIQVFRLDHVLHRQRLASPCFAVSVQDQVVDVDVELKLWVLIGST